MSTTLTDTTPKQALEQLQKRLGLTERDLEAALGVTSRTLDRWRQGFAYPQRNARNRLTELLTLSDGLLESFDSDHAAREWLHAESRYLGGLTPADAIRVGRTDRARAALEALESGVFI